uniref:Sec1 family domain-containing protein 2 n=2 Tax=Anthurium amnicola TaxID=1678845 RepID=A0A1D1YGI0_9ARAE
MDLKMEIFSLGDLSKTIGKILTDMSSLYDVGRRNKRSAGLLIIDRSLDLLTPCCHGDSVVDWIVSSLPRRERTSSLHAKNTQLPNKPISVQRAPLDVKIPLGKIFVTEASPTGNDQHLDSIRAFVLGWNSREVKDKSADLNDFKEKVDSSSLLENESGLLNGSLISCDSYKGVNYLEALLDRGIKDGVMLIKKWLLGTLHQDKVPVNLKSHLGLPSSFELLAVAKLLASNQISFIRNKGIIQLAIASVCALSEPYNSHWNAFVSAERILKMSTGDSSQSLSNQIHDFINTSILMGSEPDINNESTQGLISFQDALLIAIIGYTLAGKNFPTSGCSSPFSWEEEHSLKEAVVDAILEMPATKNLRFLRGLEEELEANLRKRKLDKHEVTTETSNMEDFEDNWGSWEEDSDYNNEPAYGDMQLKLELRDRVDHLFKLFHKMSGLKWRNPAFKDLESRFGSDSFSNKGLLYRLLLMALAKYDIPGLEYHSSAVGRFLKSGFGRFGLGQVKPSLGDQDVLLVFVVGGINGLEVREAQEAISESGRPDVQLMIGGTTLLTPDNMFELLLGSSSYI